MTLAVGWRERDGEALAGAGRRHDLRGRGHRRRAAGRRGHRRGRVQHRAVRLPGGHHRPVLRRADHHLHLPPHRQLRRDRRPTTRAAGPSAGAWSSATWPAAAAAGAATATSTPSSRRHGVPGIAGIDTRRLTRHIRDAGAMPGAFGTADEATLKAAAVAEPGTDGVDLVAEVTTAEPYTVGDGPAPGRRLRLRHQAHDPAPPRRARPRSRSCPASTPAAEVLARQPDGVFLSNGPGDPAAVPYAVDAIARAARRVPVFGICLGHQLLAGASAPRPSSCRSATTAATTRCSSLRDGPGRDHQPEPQLRGRPPTRSPARRGHPREPQRRRGRGPRGRRRAGLQRAVPPRGRPGPARRPLPVRRRSAELMRRPARRRRPA